MPCPDTLSAPSLPSQASPEAGGGKAHNRAKESGPQIPAADMGGLILGISPVNDLMADSGANYRAHRRVVRPHLADLWAGVTPLCWEPRTSSPGEEADGTGQLGFWLRSEIQASHTGALGLLCRAEHPPARAPAMPGGPTWSSEWKPVSEALRGSLPSPLAVTSDFARGDYTHVPIPNACLWGCPLSALEHRFK